MARHGLVLGKFLPPHAGHHALIEGWMTERFRERLRPPWIEVRGSVAERVEAVLSALRGC